MQKSEIKEKLTDLARGIDNSSFIYDFLSCFGLSKTTIARLRKGDYNLSKKEGELFYKGKIFFKAEETDQLIHTIDELGKDEKILKQKPRFIVVTDFENVLATDTKLKTNKEFSLNELPEQVDFFLPLSGAEIYRVSTDDKADREAAYKLAELYDMLVVDNPLWVAQGSHQLNLFLSRLLFCYFAEDTGIFSVKSIFTETLANNTKSDGSDVDAFLSLLFKKLNTEQGNGELPSYLDAFPYVNGGLFRDAIVCPEFSQKSRQILLDSGTLDWSEINPDIFGSMIQAVADPAERTNLGMHYTSVQNILKLIKPLFLDELEQEFEKNKENPRGLEKLLQRMSKIKFFDPACGSGNFLIITYKELRNLEIQVIKQLIDLDKSQRKIYFTSISLTQFYGIEIKDFAHEMAILSLWLAEHQINQVFETELLDYGQSKPILPLKEAGNIVQGNAARMNWEEVCPKKANDEIYIIGNPPYLGARIQDADQKSDMDFVFSSFTKYRDLDYISIWFYKGSKYIEGVNGKLAFVSTNSISQGQQVALLWDKVLRDKIEIFFAHHSFKWTNNAKGNAGVTVIIVGLRNIDNSSKFLFVDNIKRDTKNINAYLLDAPNAIIAERMKSISNFPRMNFGNMPNDGGGLILDEQEKNTMLAQSPDVLKFIRRLVGSTEFINGINRYCLWIEDSELDEALQFEAIKTKIEASRKHRINSKDKGTNKLALRAHQFRDRNSAIDSSIIIPRVSSEKREYIPIGFLPSDQVVLDSAMAIYDAEPWLFGVLHSKMHMVWVDAVGGKLKTDYRYSAKLCYNTFPFPSINERQKETITQYVFDILDERAKYSEKTMAWMYNPETMPSGLKQAHLAMDLAIERIYRLAPFNSDEERLEYLFKLYDEMSRKDTLFAKEKKGRKKK
ncbi:class I SAM-dependent DNA methyltransferase [Sphingobacterium hotanense]|uniref:class I SAM-dependent DNA methyltransferase n=1 Tax=Sphingobacterium hotanense TaxID=649196 RepID=UPI0011F38743|nr:DNA methyltransferase [Sphingobacterium hotanense]